MDIDLFGNAIEQKQMTSMQRSSSRQVNLTGRDLYVTEPKDIERFLNAIKKDCLHIPGPIWEPAAGTGNISIMLAHYGYAVKSSDLYPYNDSEITIEQDDFLTCTTSKECKAIFTNPPFNLQEEFLLHALSMNVDVLFFVRLSFLSSKRRHKIFEKYNARYVYAYTARAHCYKNGNVDKGQNMIDYCVMWWKPPYRNQTILRWIA